MQLKLKYQRFYQRAKAAKDHYGAFLQICEKPYCDNSVSVGALKDIIIAVKDNILVKGLNATAASKKLEGFTAPYNATVINRLLKAGAVIIGKTNLDEFAMGSSNENSAYQKVFNPWDKSKVPGGSSGGSAVAVAVEACEAALGSDTGGSIRQPSAFCGVSGLKPTYGTVSRYGLIALASSLDQIGPIAKDATTLEKVFKVISGKDKYDQTSVDYQYQSKSADIGKLKIGLPKELWVKEIDSPILKSCQVFVEFFRAKGAQIEEISMPALKYALNAYYIILPAEASSNLARYDGVRYQAASEEQKLMERYLKSRSEGFGTEVKRRIMLGTFVLSVGHYDQYYQQAMKVKQAIIKEYQQIFKKYDFLISPTTPTLPFDLNSRMQDPVKMYKADLLTVSVNLAGLPAISLPCGFEDRLPIGAQMIGNYFRENLLLDLAKHYQNETDFHKRRPNE